MNNIHNFQVRKINKPRKLYHSLKILGVMLALMIAVSFFKLQNVSYYQTDVLNLGKAPSFDGTTNPIKQIPNWVKLTEAERKLKFSDLPQDKIIDIPQYNPGKITLAISDLKWNDPEDNKIRNILITYSVPYLGNYRLEYKENVGSHPAIDIKVPYGTPVYAIANGVVTAAITSNSGFGTHIVIGHYMVPSLEDANIKETIYSSYNHLSVMNVKEGDVVLKGQKIGETGISGTATTPHLHFQIDKDTVDWHPYWPFTWAEVTAANLDFVSAINNGLGLANAQKNTINPLKYVEKYFSYTAENPVVETPKIDEVTKPEVINTETEVTNNKPEETKPEENINNNTVPENTNVTQPEQKNEVQKPEEVIILNTADFEFINAESAYIGESLPIKIKAKDQDGNILSSPQFNGTLPITISNSGATLSRNTLTRNDFIAGESAIILTGEKAGIYVVTIIFGDKQIQSKEIKIFQKVKSPNKFAFVFSGSVELNKAKEVFVVVLDEDGKMIPILTEYNIYGDLKILAGQAKIDPISIKKEDFSNGKAKVNLIIENSEVPVVLEIQGGYLYGKSDPISITTVTTLEAQKPSSEFFTDVPENHLNLQAIKFLKEKGIINGYPDGTFQPNKEVSRVEILKIIFSAAKVTLDNQAQLNFKDTENFVWYSPYVATAQSLKIASGYPDGTFKPTNSVTKVEFLRILFNAYKVDVDPVIKVKPFKDVNKLDWFASYVQLAKKLNIVDRKADYFEPGETVTRAEVAEMIYRMVKKIEK